MFYHYNKNGKKLHDQINEYKYNLHQATLEHEVITSPENISRLASEHLESDFVYYNKDQIKDLNNSEENIAQLEDANIKKKKSITNEAKKQIKKEIDKGVISSPEDQSQTPDASSSFGESKNKNRR